MFNFSFGTQPKEEEKPPFQINEQMLLTDIPNDIVKEFVDTFEKIVSNRKILQETDLTHQQADENGVRDSIQSIRDGTTTEIFGSLTSLAHQIDSGKKTIKEFEKELEISKSDYTNSSHIRSLPSPFILRFVDSVEKNAEDLSQSIAAYCSHLQPRDSLPASSLSALNPNNNSDTNNTTANTNSNNNNNNSNKNPENQILNKFLTEEHNAIVRCSSRVSKLNEQMNATRNSFAAKISRFNNINFANIGETSENSCAQSIDVKYQQFLAQIKQKNQKRGEESDLFGNSTVADQQTSTGSSFGFNFGGGKSTFGSFSPAPTKKM